MVKKLDWRYTIIKNLLEDISPLIEDMKQIIFKKYVKEIEKENYKIELFDEDLNILKDYSIEDIKEFKKIKENLKEYENTKLTEKVFKILDYYKYLLEDKEEYEKLSSLIGRDSIEVLKEKNIFKPDLIINNSVNFSYSNFDIYIKNSFFNEGSYNEKELLLKFNKKKINDIEDFLYSLDSFLFDIKRSKFNDGTEITAPTVRNSILKFLPITDLKVYDGDGLKNKKEKIKEIIDSYVYLNEQLTKYSAKEFGKIVEKELPKMKLQEFKISELDLLPDNLIDKHWEAKETLIKIENMLKEMKK